MQCDFDTEPFKNKHFQGRPTLLGGGLQKKSTLYIMLTILDDH